MRESTTIGVVEIPTRCTSDLQYVLEAQNSWKSAGYGGCSSWTWDNQFGYADLCNFEGFDHKFVGKENVKFLVGKRKVECWIALVW